MVRKSRTAPNAGAPDLGKGWEPCWPRHGADICVPPRRLRPFIALDPKQRMRARASISGHILRRERALHLGAGRRASPVRAPPKRGGCSSQAWTLLSRQRPACSSSASIGQPRQRTGLSCDEGRRQANLALDRAAMAPRTWRRLGLASHPARQFAACGANPSGGAADEQFRQQAPVLCSPSASAEHLSCPVDRLGVQHRLQAGLSRFSHRLSLPGVNVIVGEIGASSPPGSHDARLLFQSAMIIRGGIAYGRCVCDGGPDIITQGPFKPGL